MPQRAQILVLILALLQAGCIISNAPQPVPCQRVSIGVPLDSLHASRFSILGQALGQTFRANDRMITAVTVWRPAGLVSVIGAHLFITEVDTTRTPPRPNTSNIVLDGPTVTVYDSDPPGQPIPMHFKISPPLVLPHTGIFAFFLQPAHCYQGQAWNIGASTGDAYPDGLNWITTRTLNSCDLPPLAGGEDIDLIFQIDFCR